jgi:tryptophan-rich sensory protein
MKKEKKSKCKINWKLLIIAFISVILVAFIGSQFTGPNTSTEWYESIKPSITPPNWVFPIVWNILFFLIALAFYFTLLKGNKSRVAVVFAINFILNILWSVLYFGLKNPLLAFIEIIVLWFSILYLVIFSFKIDKKAGWFLLPYLIWVSFAAILNVLSI